MMSAEKAGKIVGATVGRWWDRLPPSDSPIWKIVHTITATGCGLVLITYMARNGVHMDSIAGAGVGSGATLLLKSIFGKNNG